MRKLLILLSCTALSCTLVLPIEPPSSGGGAADSLDGSPAIEVLPDAFPSDEVPIQRLAYIATDVLCTDASNWAANERYWLDVFATSADDPSPPVLRSYRVGRDDFPFSATVNGLIEDVSYTVRAVLHKVTDKGEDWEGGDWTGVVIAPAYNEPLPREITLLRVP